MQRELLLPDNTKKAYLPRLKEWEEYCDQRYPGEEGRHSYRYAITREKLVPFIFYQCMREKKSYSCRNQRRPFDIDDFHVVIDKYQHWLYGIQSGTQGQSDELPEPSNPLQAESIQSYRAAIHWLWQDHNMARLTGLTWDQIWPPCLKYLLEQVKRRGPEKKRKNYVEKIDHVFSPYQLVEQFSKIELQLWNHGNTSIKSAFSWLKYRYCFLHSTHGILRCESIFKGELSDCSMLKMPGDPHEMLMLVQQIAIGKTNQDSTRIFGRVMRHKNVLVCGVGAFAMYLALRFHITREFELDNFPLSNWSHNSSWFDVKLLVDAFNPERNLKVVMSNNSYSRAIRTVLKELRLTSTHFVHLGRKIGPKELEMLQADPSQIDQLGNWSTNVREQRYSAKLPVEAIKLKAGFTKSSTHHNIRQSIAVPPVLLQSTPFDFCYSAESYMTEEMQTMPADQHHHITAIKFIDLMKELNIIFLQDMAVIAVADPDRQSHPIFSLLPVFQMEEWKTFCESVRATIDADKIATASQATMGVEQYLPGLLDQFSVLHGRLSSMEQKMDQQGEKIDSQGQSSSQKLEQLFLAACKGAYEHVHANVVGTGEYTPLQPQATTATTCVTNTGRQAPRPAQRFESLSKLWSDWSDRFEALDYTGAGWRSCYSPSESKHFSRVKQVITGMRNYIKQHRHGQQNSPEQILPLLDDHFMQLNRSLPKMIQWMQQEGYLQKSKSRGRSKQQQETM
jgi:hypothetical protein